MPHRLRSLAEYHVKKFLHDLIAHHTSSTESHLANKSLRGLLLLAIPRVAGLRIHGDRASLSCNRKALACAKAFCNMTQQIA